MSDGTTMFLGLELFTTPDVLVPRAETELLARVAIEWLRSAGTSRPVVIDMCSGAGNLTCVIGITVPGARIYGSDIAEGAVELARRNVARHGLDRRVRVLAGDLFEPLGTLGLERATDLVVSNPPYISSGRLERDRAHLLLEEPRLAFDGGPYGLSIQQRVIRESVRFLRAGGALAMEIGDGQARQVETLIRRSGAFLHTRFVNGGGGAPRVVVATRAPESPRAEA